MKAFQKSSGAIGAGILLNLASLAASAGSLADIDHVVLFMQENRAFDHYFGTMAGVRGYADPNVQVDANGRSVFYQNVNGELSKKTDYLLPWYLNYLGGDYPEATQCMEAGDNGWNDNHAALNNGLNNKWALNNTPWSWGYYQKQDLPIHFAAAEGWTVGDMYQQSVIASTNPNRVSWISGSINCPGSPQKPDQGGIYIDNNEVPGCEAPHLSCYPLKWKTAPEYYQDAGVTWQVYQDTDNFDDNPLAWFKQFQQALPTSELYKRGMTFIGLDQFYKDCEAGTLPEISYIVGPAELSEHPPYQPKDGAWLQYQIIEALVKSKSYKKSVLMISYDETGGWGDHVTPYHSPKNTPGEWVEDPYGVLGDVYTGPGFRLPFYIISPWTRGGNVYVEHADHSSQIKFIEQWQAAKGKNVTTSQIPHWRRKHMADLTKAFDFSSPDYSIPDIPLPETPSKNKAGQYNGYATCAADYATTRPPVPYGTQSPETSLITEQGFKSVRGMLTEGRYLTFEMNGYGLARSQGKILKTKKATPTHNDEYQRFVLHQTRSGGHRFKLSSAVDGYYLTRAGFISTASDDALVFAIDDLGNGRGHTIKNVKTGKYLGISPQGKVEDSSTAAGFQVFSVTYTS